MELLKELFRDGKIHDIIWWTKKVDWFILHKEYMLGEKLCNRKYYKTKILCKIDQTEVIEYFG